MMGRKFGEVNDVHLGPAGDSESSENLTSLSLSALMSYMIQFLATALLLVMIS